MNKETKNCQNCHQNFVVESEDFQFYEKIKVPPPTFCPRCRLERRLAFFNITNLYKRKCDLCGIEKISMYSPEAPYQVYCPECWWGDNWDPLSYGQDYDFNRPFFEQFNNLWRQVPLLGLSLDLTTTKNSPHNNHSGHLKNCYMLFHSDFCEDSAYGFFHVNNKSCFDCSAIMLSELCFDTMNSYKNNHCIGSRNQITESINCSFVRDAHNCQNCFGSANIRSQKYQFFNQQLTKEEYQNKLKDYDLGSYKKYQETKLEVEKHWKKFSPKPYYEEFNIDSTGNYVFQSKNCQECFEVMGAENCKFTLLLSEPPIKDSYDITSWGNNLELCYEGCNIGENVSNIKFGQESGINLINAEYVKLSTGGSNHFGCVSVKKGNFVIFNKQYPETEYFKLKEKIKTQMNDLPYVDRAGRTYRYGEFFPIELSPWAYNETLANNFFKLTPNEINNKKYNFKTEIKQSYHTTLQSQKLPDHIKDTDENILQEIIQCEKCERGYRIIQLEFDFLKKMNLPLPRQCPLCRVNEKLNRWVKNMQSLKRTCMKCNDEFLTPFNQDEAPIIYCKNCWQKEYL